MLAVCACTAQKSCPNPEPLPVKSGEYVFRPYKSDNGSMPIGAKLHVDRAAGRVKLEVGEGANARAIVWSIASSEVEQ